jgi:hypothetical protein
VKVHVHHAVTNKTLASRPALTFFSMSMMIIRDYLSDNDINHHPAVPPFNSSVSIIFPPSTTVTMVIPVGI